MRIAETISPVKKNKKLVGKNSQRDTFIKNNILNKTITTRVQAQESKADNFAQKAMANAVVFQVFLNARDQLSPQKSRNNNTGAQDELKGSPLPETLTAVFKQQFNLDFTDVQLHADELSTKISRQYNATALTSGKHIFLNTDTFNPAVPEGLMDLAHELFHTLEPGNKYSSLEIQLKPLTELNDRTPEKKLALERAVKIAVGEKGKVNSGVLNEDKTRVGWEFLLEYFKTTMGEDTIVKDRSEYKPGKFLEEVIKYVRKGKAQKVKIVDGVHTVVTEDNVDLLPSWCGIFAFWALHKAGIHPPPWQLGKPNFTSSDQYKKGEYLPRHGDIVIKSGYNHHALVVRTEPETITDTKELQNVKVITINGNTAGSNHQGGQIQEKTDSYSYWDFYINPFFKGVELTKEADYKVDERLKKSLGKAEASPAGDKKTQPVDLGVNQYNTTTAPIAGLDIAKPEGEKKEETQAIEVPKLSPKEIMAKDAEFSELQASLEKNAKDQKEHDTPENKAGEAQKSAVSPGNERISKAKAVKVEKLGALPKPKEFKAEELKNNILKQVEELLKEKEKEANDTGEKPKIKQDEIAEVKQANAKDIKDKKTESIGEVETTHKEKPDESGIEERKEGDVVVEEAGPSKKIPGTEKAVAKPIAEERITLENDSAKIDDKMAENDVDETQLEESNEEKFTGSLQEKRGSQAEAAKVKEDYRAIEDEKLEKDKKTAKATVNTNVDKLHGVRSAEFGNVNLVKNNTKSADELKRKEISDALEKIYTDSEKSVNDKLVALEATVSIEFDAIMTTANTHFKDNINNGLDEEFTWEWAAKRLDRSDYNQRVKKVFVRESDKYKQELSDALTPLTNKIADTLNAILTEIQAAKDAVVAYVKGLPDAFAEIGVQSAKGILDKFSTLEQSVNEKQEALTNSLAKKYADGVTGLEAEFKKIMDSRKSWLEKALDAIIDAIKEIINLFIDLKKALERAAEYGKRIIKAPLKFFGNLVRGATDGFNNFVKNIGKHLLQGALEWVTGEMSDAGIQLPEKFDFKGILSIILQVLGISVNNVKEIAKNVIGAKYVAMLEKGVDIGVKAGDKILQIFSIIKKDGIAGLWEFIKEQFNDLKEKMMEEAKSFIVVTIVEVAVVKVVSMLIPGAGFISAVKSLIDFLRTLFAKARQIVNIITGIIDTFGEILAGNVAKVSSMVENVLAKFLSLAITFLAAILGLGKVGKKINDIIQKKIKDPINKAITKMMEKLKAVMTKLGVFKFLDNVEKKIQKGKNWVDEKKEKVKQKASETLNKLKGFLKGLTNKYTDESGETHTLKFKDTELYRESVSVTLGNYLLEVREQVNSITNPDQKKKHQETVNKCFALHRKIVDSIGETVKKSGGEYEGTDKGFRPAKGEELRKHLNEIAGHLRTLPIKNKKIIPETIIEYHKSKVDGENANAPLISLDSNYTGSQPTGANSPLTQSIIKIVRTKRDNHNLVRGHLINHELYGTGEDTKNLAPIPKMANSAMLNTFETKAKELVHSNNVISLKVTMNYGDPNDKIDSGKSLLKKKLPPGTQIPVSIKYNLKHLEFNGDSNAKAVINDHNKWKPFKDYTGNPIPINHDDFF